MDSSVTVQGAQSDYINSIAERNALIGDLDYQRTLDLMSAQQNFNAEQAQLNRQFQERMSDTAYSRAYRDIQSIGLNPYLILSSGGASSPSGASASYSGASAPSAGSSFGSVFSTKLSNAANIAIAELNNDTKIQAATISAIASILNGAMQSASRAMYNEHR